MQTMPISSYHIMFYKFHKAHIVMIYIMACFWSVIVASNKKKDLLNSHSQRLAILVIGRLNRYIPFLLWTSKLQFVTRPLGSIADILKITKSSSIHNIAIYLHLVFFLKTQFLRNSIVFIQLLTQPNHNLTNLNLIHY